MKDDETVGWKKEKWVAFAKGHVEGRPAEDSPELVVVAARVAEVTGAAGYQAIGAGEGFALLFPDTEMGDAGEQGEADKDERGVTTNGDMRPPLDVEAMERADDTLSEGENMRRSGRATTTVSLLRSESNSVVCWWAPSNMRTPPIRTLRLLGEVDREKPNTLVGDGQPLLLTLTPTPSICVMGLVDTK
jgi:hypothetical protein